jgi:autotransporter-associated beta strand protein
MMHSHPNTLPNPRSRRIALTLASSVLVALSTPAFAQLTWSGAGGDNNWSTGANWGGTAPSSLFNNTLTFNGTTRTTSVNNVSGLTLTGLTFNNSDWNISGNALTLNGNLNGAAGRSVTVVNDITVSGARTLQTQNAAASSLTLSGAFSASGLTVTKDGSGTIGNSSISTLTFNGDGKAVTIGTFAHRKGDVIIDNGVAATIGTVQIGNDATNAGIDPAFTLRGSATTLATSGNIEIARAANAARLKVESGTLTANTLLTGQSASSLVASGYYQTGGTANIGNLRSGNNGNSTISISGGTMNVGVTSATNSKLVEAGSTAMNISGGALNVTAATVAGSTITFTGSTGAAVFNLAHSASGTPASTGTINLTGGVLTVGGFSKSNSSSTTTINLNGGTLRAGASSATFLDSTLANTTVRVGDNGAVIDTNGFNITVAAPLLANGMGGLAKNSSGTLTLGGVNTFRGDTTVSAGSLTLANAGALTFYLGNNASNRVAGTGNATFDGSFRIDFSSASGSSWNLVAPSISASYVGFNGLVDIAGAQTFVKQDSLWTSVGYVFDETTGTLSAIPEPSACAALAGLAALGLVGRRRRHQSSARPSPGG